MNRLTMIKLGGSAITFKDKFPPTINESVINNAAEDIASYNGKVIIVLGGGAHGHQAAHKYGYGNNKTPKKRLLKGVPEIRRNMSLLSSQVEQIFNEYHVGAVVVDPFSFALMRSGKILSFPTDIIRMALEANLMVITHGDVCFDEQRGASILSGDVIITHLARELGASRLLLGTNVDGVFTQDPTVNSKAELVSEINIENRGGVIEGVTSSSRTDVTGGMNLKLRELLNLAENGIEIVIFNLEVPHRLKKVLEGQNVPCTRVCL